SAGSAASSLPEGGHIMTAVSRGPTEVLLLLPLALLAACSYPEPSTPLARAAVADDAAAIRTLVAAGQPVNAKDASGWTALIWAARLGRTEATRTLLQAGANPDLADSYINGWTPLMHAAHKRQIKTIEALLQAGADPNARAKHGATALMLAACEPDQ